MTHNPTSDFMRGLGTCLAILFLGAGSAAGQEPSRVLPPALNAPQVGEAMPDFTLPDMSGAPVTFSEFLASGEEGQPGWVLLVFYRGYW